MGALRELQRRWSGVDHSPEVLPGAWGSSCCAAEGYRLDRIARNHDFLGRYLTALWVGQRVASGGLCTRVWDLP